jgi:hypothetical protein
LTHTDARGYVRAIAIVDQAQAIPVFARKLGSCGEEHGVDAVGIRL